MKKRPWIFPAITLLLLANFLLGSHPIGGSILFLLWFLRIILLKDKTILWRIILISIFFVLIVCFHQVGNKSVFKGEEDSFIVSPELSSIKIDGDYLSFTGIVQETNKKDTKEKMIVHNYFQTADEKAVWLNLSTPSFFVITGELKKPAGNSNFNQFNYQNYLKRNKIHWQLNTEKMKQLEGFNFKKTLSYKIDQLRYQIIQYIDHVFHEKVSSYLKILFLAEKSALTEETKQSYRALGLIHLFSISGFHISYLANALEKLFLRIGISHERKDLLLVVLLPFYGLIAGLSVSIFRAVCQKTLLLGSTILDKELDSLDAWSLTMILSLLINPYSIFELSFQLSYSLSGLFILMGQQKSIKELNTFRKTFLLSFLSFLVSLPLLSYHFYEVQWITVFTNLIFIPFFTFFLFPILVSLFLMSFFLSNTFIFLFFNKNLAFILLKVEDLLLMITERFNFSFVIGRLPQLLLILLLICILYLLKKIEQRKTPSILVILLIVLSINWNKLSPVGYVLMLDVGQGDSVLIKEPMTRKITLIDTGGEIQWLEKEKWQKREKSFSVGKDIVVPSLKSLGISSIDRLYITHAHEDHMGEIENIEKEIKIKEVATASSTLQHEKLVKKLVNLKESQILELCPNIKLDYPTSNTVALQPIKDYKSKNDQSLVLYVKMGEDYWLFTGDMEEEAESDLIQEYPKMHVDYLKVAHHGSNTSSKEEFIDHIEPETALISVGKKNRYGHPNTEVLELLDERKINTYSTAENGAIKVSYFKIPLSDKWFIKKETVK